MVIKTDFFSSIQPRHRLSSLFVECLLQSEVPKLWDYLEKKARGQGYLQDGRFEVSGDVIVVTSVRESLCFLQWLLCCLMIYLHLEHFYDCKFSGGLFFLPLT